MKIRVILDGAAGRMGRMLIELMAQDPGLELAAALEAAGHPALGRDAGELVGARRLGVPVSTGPVPAADVLINFSLPEAAVERCVQAAKSGVALLVGTTGFTPDQKARIESLASQVPVLIAPNMSVGVNVLFSLAKQAAAKLGESFDVEIVEAHHRRKKDAPSGTARRLLESVCEARNCDPDQVAVYGRQGIVGERPDAQIGVLAVRGGDIVGDHTVLFAGPGERIELVHRAHSREVFARGAIRAAKFLAGNAPGIYSMNDVLGL